MTEFFSSYKTFFHPVGIGISFELFPEKKEDNMNTLMKKNGNGVLPAASFGGMVDKIFQDNLSRFFDDSLWGFSGLARNVNIPVNIRETDKTYEMELVAPGLKKEDFKINVSGELLTVSFEHTQESNQENKEQGWLRKEYKAQSFSRSFNIDNTVDANKISAKYSDGILHLSLPEKE